MGKLYRSARGVMVDFDLLAIKQQLAAMPATKAAEDRKRAMDNKDGVKTDVKDDLSILAAGLEAAAASRSAAQIQSPEKEIKPNRGAQLANK